MFKLIRVILVALVVFAFALPASAVGAGTDVNGVKAAPTPLGVPADLR